MTKSNNTAAVVAEDKRADRDGKRKHKPHHRSPNYPSITLGDAIDRTRTIYEHEKRTATSPSVIAGHLGFSTITGPTGRVLSALKQYGLLEETDGKLRVSDAAFKILMLTEESDERNALIRKAALSPQLFKELVAEYKEDRPSPATLRHHLIFQKSFNPTSVDQFIRIFNATIDLANLYVEGYTSGELAGDEDPSGEQGMEMPAPTLHKQAQRGHPYGPTLEMRRLLGEIPEQKSYTEAINQRISEHCRVRVLFEGPVTRKAVDKLIRYLELAKEDYPSKDTLKIGDSVKVLSNTQHRDQIGKIVGIGEQSTDMVGPVQGYWVEFPEDAEGPYPYDDNDLWLTAESTQT